MSASHRKYDSTSAHCLLFSSHLFKVNAIFYYIQSVSNLHPSTKIAATLAREAEACHHDSKKEGEVEQAASGIVHSDVVLLCPRLKQNPEDESS